MGRRKLPQSVKECRERQRSQSRRHRQQQRTVTEAASDPTIRILRIYDEETQAAGETEQDQAATQDIPPAPAGHGPPSTDCLETTLDGNEGKQNDKETDYTGRNKQDSIWHARNTPNTQAGLVRKEDRDNHPTPSPSTSETTTGRYHLRERRSATPTAPSTYSPEVSIRNTNKNGSPSQTLSLPIRPASEKGPVYGQRRRSEEAEPPAQPAPHATSATRRVRQHRAEQRITRQQQHIHEANQSCSQVRAILVPENEPPADPIDENPAPTEPNPFHPHDEHTPAEANAVDDTLVRSVIFVSTDESDCLGATAPSVNDSNATHEGTAAEDDTVGVAEASEGGSLEALVDTGITNSGDIDESGLFVSDESWNLGSDEDDPRLSTPSVGPTQWLQGQPEHSPATLVSAPGPITADPLHDIIAAIESAETGAGQAFVSRQADAYKRIFQETLPLGCACEQSHQEQSDEERGGFSMKEMTDWFQDKLGPIQEVLAPSQPNDTREQSEGRRWQALLARPPASLSLPRSECDPQRYNIQMARSWDVDSIWLGATSLAAIRPDNSSFRLSFNPHYTRSIAGNQIIQPHGVDLGHTRHTLLGSFIAGGIPMDVFVFFPNTNDGRTITPKRARHKRAAKSPYTLSLARQQDLVNGAILPAVQSSLPALFRQEMPPTFAIANAKCKSYQEKPATDRWATNDSARAAHLRYTVPGPYLGAFWRDFQTRCDRIRIPVTNNTAGFAYFQSPKLLFQVHDTKNTFARPTVGQSLDLFVGQVMHAFDPSLLDFRSCWLDVGFRDLATATSIRGQEETPVTLLWKKGCLEHFHAGVQDISPHMGLQSEYFRTFHMRDAATYNAKVRGAAGHVPRPADPGHPSCPKLGVIHAKAYDCDKERFSVITSDYRPFAAPSLAALALTETMMRDVFTAGHDRTSAVTGAPQRKKLEAAWEANKRHLHAVSDHHSPTNGYAARKEITFRLDVIMTMLHRGLFAREEQSGNPHGPTVGGVVPTQLGDAEHYPFWLVPTAEVNDFVCTLACRFVKPLDSVFAMGAARDETTSLAKQGARSLVYFYTAELFLRLLTSSLTSDRDYFADKWIWERQWSSKQERDGRRVQYTRRGLGLREAIYDNGLLWLQPSQLDWMHGHLSIPELLQLYIPRNPQHPQWAAQSSVRAFGCSNVSVAYLIEDLVLKAARIRRHDPTSAHLAIVHEKTAVQIAAQEVAREYGLHMLSKLLLYWRKAVASYHHVQRDYPNGPHSLAAALEALQLPIGRMVTPYTILDILDEAWPIWRLAEGSDTATDLPAGLPNWMAKRAPKEQLWTRVVFFTLFETQNEVTWARNAFRLLYHRLRELYDTARHPDAVPFCDTFRDTVGRYITVMSNPDRSKEMNVAHGSRYCHGHLPPFFRIQFWAPIINPFRYRADTFEVKQPTFPLTERWKRAHQKLQLRNADLLQSFRAVRGLSITATWVARQPAETILRLVGDLQRCLACLLRLAGPRRSNMAGGQSSSYWNFNDADSVDLQLWEVPIEGGSIHGGAVPTVILPTRPILHFILRASEAAASALPLLPPSSVTQIRDEIGVLQEWICSAKKFLENTLGRQTLIGTKLKLLEDTKILHDDSADDGLLFQFLDQTEAPQTCTYLNAEDLQDDCEEAIMQSSVGSASDCEDSSSYTSSQE